LTGPKRGERRKRNLAEIHFSAGERRSAKRKSAELLRKLSFHFQNSKKKKSGRIFAGRKMKKKFCLFLTGRKERGHSLDQEKKKSARLS